MAETGIFVSRSALKSFQNAKKVLQAREGGRVLNDMAVTKICTEWSEAQPEEARAAADE